MTATALRPASRTVRIGPLSTRWRPRQVLVVPCCLLVVLGLAVLSTALGDVPIALSRVLAVLVGGGDAADRLVVLELRLPRTVVGLLVGAALACSGAVTQAVLRNPLASPDVLGVTAGAGAGAVAVIVLGGAGGAASGALAQVGVPLAALVGGVASSTVIYLLARRGGVEGYRFVLVGVAAAGALTAVTSWLLVVGDVIDASRATVWLTGSLNGRGAEQAWPVAIAVALLVPVLVVLGRGIDALVLGDDVARGLGVLPGTVRLGALVAAVLLASVATSAAGPVAFVALVCPHLARLLVGGARPPLIVCALLGAALVTGSDLVARVLLPAGVPVGVVTASVGAAYLLGLLVRTSRKASA